MGRVLPRLTFLLKAPPSPAQNVFAVVRNYSTENANVSGTPKRPHRIGRILKLLLGGTAAVGTCTFIGSIAINDYKARQDPKHYYSDWKIRLYTSLPLAALSRTFGCLSRITVPEFMREALYGSFARSYDCRLDEAANSSLKSYPNFAAFFNRSLKEDARPISAISLVSPADGTVLHFGEVENRRIEYVKGHDYDVSEFLGPSLPEVRPGNSLYQVVVYLAPGDYHAFHSPTDWHVSEKIHYPGFLLSVKPAVLDWIPKLFCLNERVVLSGQWKHGFFSMSAVAATNVGDINIDMGSNEKLAIKTSTHSVFSEDLNYARGGKVGEFRLGSTIVLIFEAPEPIRFSIRAGDTLRYGQSLIVKDI